MISNLSRRHWLKFLSAGMSGLLVSETAKASDRQPFPAFNPDLAQVALRDAIKITKLEISSLAHD